MSGWLLCPNKIDLATLKQVQGDMLLLKNDRLPWNVGWAYLKCPPLKIDTRRSVGQALPDKIILNLNY